MPFPTYVHSVISNSDDAAWPVQAQGENECGCTVAANALNILSGWRRFDKDQFVREAGLFFQRKLGGSPSPVTGWLIQQHGYGTHFGNLLHTNPDIVLRDLIDRGVPVGVELGSAQFGPIHMYGQHSILLVGYSDQQPEEYYFVDSQYPPTLGRMDLHTNDRTVNGVTTAFPGNRTILRDEFLRMFETGIYFPVFRSQSAHDDWYRANIRVDSPSIIDKLSNAWFTGSPDIWVDTHEPVQQNQMPSGGPARAREVGNTNQARPQ